MQKKTRIVLTVTVLGLFVAYFLANTEKFRPLLHLNSWLLLLIAIGDIAIIISNGLLTKYILRPFDKNLPLRETSYIALITSVGNFFAPVGAGLVVRAVYLKKKHQVSYGDYIPILAGNYLIVFLVNAFFGLLALVLLRSRADAHYRVLVLAFLGILLFSLTLALVKIPSAAIAKLRNKKLASLFGMFSKISEGWERIADNKKLLGQLTLITTLNLFLTAAITWLIILSLHLHVGFGVLLLFSVISALSLFLNITPANLGVKEALYIFSAGVLGFSTNQILSIALIDRGVSFLIMFVSYVALRFNGVYPIKSK